MSAGRPGMRSLPDTIAVVDPHLLAGILLIAGLVLFMAAAAWPPLIPVWPAGTLGDAELGRRSGRARPL
jgi:hypothetical protein